MNAAETIAAAIEKLETLKLESTPGEWSAPATILGLPNTTVFASDAKRKHAAYVASAHDGQLIVTLHRTIDAQLAILRHDLEIRQKYEDLAIFQSWERAVEEAGDLALARAILGQPETPHGSIPDPLEGNPYDLIAGEDYEDES